MTRTKSEKMAYFQVLARFEREIFIVCKIKPGMPGRPFGSGSISAVSNHPRGFARIVGRVLALGREKSRGVGRDRDCGDFPSVSRPFWGLISVEDARGRRHLSHSYPTVSYSH